jgi:hypothetical protein
MRTPTITTAAFLCLSIALATSAHSQQRQHVTYKNSAETTKYVQQLNVDAGDVPNHIVRVFDLHRTHQNGPVIDGIKLVEETARGTTDITDGNGSSVVYQVFVMENGDRFFAKLAQVNQKNGDKISASGIGPITGGTGKLADIHGTVQFVVNFDVKSGFNEGQSDIEYFIGK